MCLLVTVRSLFSDVCDFSGKHVVDPVKSDLTVATAEPEWLSGRIRRQRTEVSLYTFPFNPDSFEDYKITVCKTCWGPWMADAR